MCEEKEDDQGGNYDCHWENIYDICENCLKSCKTCNLKFHDGKCKVEHQKTCNHKGRAERAYASVKGAVEGKEEEIQETKRTLAEMEGELKAAKKAKTKAR